MIRHEPKRKRGSRAYFQSQYGDSKMAVRIDGRDLIFVLRDHDSPAFGIVRTLEMVDLDGKVHRISSTKKLVGGFHVEVYAGIDCIHIHIDDLEPDTMKVI